jgi:hypothetical protein
VGDLTGDLLVSNGSYGKIYFDTSPSGAPFAPDDPRNYFFGLGQVYSAPVGTV